ncbi:MAG: hypothetical protein MJ219_01205 [Mycoplasmoidaceae bacterium]|nr:hypothetical protein [Mycoplasmoidaceae bacterium]
MGLNGNMVLPSVGDLTGQDTDLFYIQNKMCSKLTLDHVIGLGSIASNP